MFFGLSDIGCYRIGTKPRRNITLFGTHKDIYTIAPIVIEIYRQKIRQEYTFKSNVILGSRFPSSIRVTNITYIVRGVRWNTCLRISYFSTVGNLLPLRHIQPLGYIVVAPNLTPRVTKFHEIYIGLSGLHKRFVGKNPTGSQGGEESELMSFVELFRTVVGSVSFKQVGIFISISHTGSPFFTIRREVCSGRTFTSFKQEQSGYIMTTFKIS